MHWQPAECNVDCRQRIMPYTLCNVILQFTLRNMQCDLYNVHIAKCRVYYTMCNVHQILQKTT